LENDAGVAETQKSFIDGRLGAKVAEKAREWLSL
jgi:hypothetical protein